jgi:hypothetical protein
MHQRRAPTVFIEEFTAHRLIARGGESRFNNNHHKRGNKTQKLIGWGR